MIKLRPFIKWCASLKITVICLLLFMVITLLGTFYQIDHDINEARKLYFTSWFVLLNGMIPFPGGQTVIWIFFINMIAACFTRFGFSWKKSGIWLTHIGLIGLCFSSFYTYKYSKEGMVSLLEGDKTQVASMDNNWELSVWTEKDGLRNVTGFPLDRSKSGMPIAEAVPGMEILLKEYYPSAKAYQDFSELDERPLNGSMIVHIEEENVTGQSFPGAIFTLAPEWKDKVTMMLYGAENDPTSFELKGETWFFQLRPQKLKLPVVIKLDDVMQETYARTNIAKRYESRVTLMTESGERQARIYMNHPLTIDDFTFYQSGYSEGMAGRESSTLSVVKNAGKYYPYVACVIITIGMILHFCIVFARMFRRKRREGEAA